MKQALSLFELLREAASRNGFPISGAVDIGSVPIEPHVARYDEWLGRGFAGDMSYLERGRERRAKLDLVFPGAKSVFCVAMPYSAWSAGESDPMRGARYARYIRGDDYHERLAELLEKTLRETSEAWQKSGQPALRWKACVDTSAVLERSWAALAGLGWIGKNTLLIHPRHGSYLLLAEALIDQPVERGPRPLPDYCGSCQRCLEACPTQALREPHWLDSKICVSYLTLEKRGRLDLEERTRSQMGRWVAGCDVCQEVCPFNTKATRAAEKPAPEEGAQSLSGWRELLLETEEEYRTRVKLSSLRRVKPPQFRRNLAIALSNAITELAANERQSFAAGLLPLVRQREENETDEAARLEWTRCLGALETYSVNRNP